jgi:putative membrane protein
MIIKEKVAWLRLLFYFRGTSFEKTWPRILAVTAVSVIVTYVELYYNIQNYTLTTTPFTLIGIALGIFLGFRNSAAYDRFWGRAQAVGVVGQYCAYACAAGVFTD